MATHHDVLDAEHGYSVFNRRGNTARDACMRGHDIACIANDEQIARLGLCDQVGIDARIGAGDEQNFGALPIREFCEQCFSIFKRQGFELHQTGNNFFHKTDLLN